MSDMPITESEETVGRQVQGQAECMSCLHSWEASWALGCAKLKCIKCSSADTYRWRMLDIQNP